MKSSSDTPWADLPACRTTPGAINPKIMINRIISYKTTIALDYLQFVVKIKNRTYPEKWLLIVVHNSFLTWLWRQILRSFKGSIFASYKSSLVISCDWHKSKHLFLTCLREFYSFFLFLFMITCFYLSKNLKLSHLTPRIWAEVVWGQNKSAGRGQSARWTGWTRVNPVAVSPVSRVPRRSFGHRSTIFCATVLVCSWRPWFDSLTRLPSTYTASFKTAT